ncbi:uncharacterized protein LOC124153950 [Ischnura elegans]|uniref:uncharacterized protein LOC124153950 n=1 Tax=Ischnura elegans TaxID=197161 RepID=UPI001ED8B7F1|nr:uncharacterized protein LOC124153950 [Ischnura elegans]
MDVEDSPLNTSSDETLAKSVNAKHLTPCRQVGLRRKIGSAKSDNTSVSKKICLPAPSFGTPKGAYRFPTRKILMSPSENPKSECPLGNNNIECKTPSSGNVNASDIDKDSECNVIDSKGQVSNGGNKSEFSFDPKATKSVEEAKSALEEIKRRVDAKEKLKSSLQQRLYKMKKGNEHVARLKSLQEDWKEACQGSLRDLLDKTNMQGQFLTMKQLMEKLGISNELLPYNSDEEEFGECYP